MKIPYYKGERDAGAAAIESSGRYEYYANQIEPAIDRLIKDEGLDAASFVFGSTAAEAATSESDIDVQIVYAIPPALDDDQAVVYLERCGKANERIKKAVEQRFTAYRVHIHGEQYADPRAVQAIRNHRTRAFDTTSTSGRNINAILSDLQA